jgi:histidine phosphotransfer protein HptB
MPTTRNLELLTPVMEPESTLRRLGDDIELMEQIIHIFLEDAPELVHAARQAMSRGDAAELRRAAHSLKGLLATLSAPAGVNAAFRLEQAAASGDLTTASLIQDCGDRVAEVLAALRAYCDSGAPAGETALPSRS